MPALVGLKRYPLIGYENGGYKIIAAIPTITHDDERFYVVGVSNWGNRSHYVSWSAMPKPDSGHWFFEAGHYFDSGDTQLRERAMVDMAKRAGLYAKAAELGIDTTER